MIAARDVANWLRTLPAGAGVCIDEGGLTLLGPHGARLEVGGEPLPHRDPPPRLPYLSSCVNWNPDDIEALTQLVDNARQISRESFTYRVSTEDRLDLESRLGYTRSFPIAHDWAVTYWSGRLHGRPAYFLTHSAIEYVFADTRNP